MTSQEKPSSNKRSTRKGVGPIGFITGGLRIHRNKEMMIGGGIVVFFVIVSVIVAISRRPKDSNYAIQSNTAKRRGPR